MLKATCLNLRHAFKDDRTIYLDAELSSTTVHVPITPTLNRVSPTWNRSDVERLGAAMPKYIELQQTDKSTLVDRNAFSRWWELSKDILQAGVLLEHQKSVYGAEFVNAWWFRCTPRCYADPLPISSTTTAQNYIKEKLSVMGEEALREVSYDTWRLASINTLRLGDGYINAYSFSRKLIADPDIALALAFNALTGMVDVENSDIDKKYGLTYK